MLATIALLLIALLFISPVVIAETFTHWKSVFAGVCFALGMSILLAAEIVFGVAVMLWAQGIME